MIADLKPYATYRESGQPWLGRVPSHWSVVPNRALFAEVIDRNHPDEEMLSVTITDGVVRQRSLLEAVSKKDGSNLDKSNYKRVQPGDIAYNKMRAWQGAIGASKLRGIISPAYIVMRLRRGADLPSYFHYLYRTPNFAKEAERWSYGITSDMWSLRPEHFRMIYAPDPSLAEQAAIVRFLDWANGRLERAIQAKQKLIALLNERKRAIIHCAVTRGLDSHVPLRPSCVRWLGEVPAQWRVERLKRVALLHRGYDLPEYDRRPGPFPVVTSGGVVGAHSEAKVDGPGVVTGRYGSTGTIYYIDVDYWPHNTALYVSDFRGNYPRFIYYLLQILAFGAHNDKSAVPGVDRKDLHEIHVPCPSPEEQVRIAAGLDSALGGLDLALTSIRREVDLVREYRTRLFADVVTGKLDVREAAARLPEEAAPDTAEPGSDLSADPEVLEPEAAV